MPLLKQGCRATERTEMKKLQLQGYNAKQISEKVRVNLAVVTDVLSGSWDEKETEAAKRQQKLNAERITGRQKEEQDKISMIAAAAAHAVKASMTSDPVVDEDAIRAEIEAKVRAELAAEQELTRGQKAAATRAANKRAEDSQEEDAA
jgi:hypothetical protein